MIQIQERPDEHDVDRHPDRAAPIGVPAEHPGVGLGRQVIDPVLPAAGVQYVRVLLVEPGEGPDAVLAQELGHLPHGPFGGGYRLVKVPVYKRFADPAQNLILLRKDSHSRPW